MQKTPTLCQAGVSGSYSSRNIVPRIPSKNQLSSTNCSSPHICQSNQLARLTAAIERKDLHDCLEILEEAGFRSELALFVLANIQQGAAR